MSQVLTLRGRDSKLVSLNMYFNNPQVKCWAKNMDGSVQKQKINLNKHGSLSSQEYKRRQERYNKKLQISHGTLFSCSLKGLL